jgi:hypothetical protein
MVAFLLATSPAVAAGSDLPDKCNSADPKEVVVCGSRARSQRYRLPKLPHEYDRAAIRAQTTVAGLPTRLHVDSVDLPGGQHSNRAMITISTSF